MAPRISWKIHLQLFLIVAIPSNVLTLKLDVVTCMCISCKWQPKNMIDQKNLAGHSGFYTSYLILWKHAGRNLYFCSHLREVGLANENHDTSVFKTVLLIMFDVSP